MPAVHTTIQILEQLVKDLPIGTNLGLLHLMWTLISGHFLTSRGSIHAALTEAGFSASETRRAWAAFRYGSWSVFDLIGKWRTLVLNGQHWQRREYEGYCPVAVDTTGFWRPRLQNWGSKLFYRVANRAVQGVGIGIIADIGQIGSQRVPLLKGLTYMDPHESESDFKHRTLLKANEMMADNEVAIHDAGVTLGEVQEAGIKRFVLRMAKNATARRNWLAKYVKGRPSEYGERIRPWARKWKERLIPATAADIVTTFEFGGHTIQAYGWQQVVGPLQKVNAEAPTFNLWLFIHPLYEVPWLLATNLLASPETVYRLYVDRWPVEQPPLVAKQLLGLHRHFVFAWLSCFRLPALGLLVGNILTYVAAIMPPQPAGFWDRRPKRTSGRLRRVLYRTGFPKLYQFHERLREKQSQTDHLPKGIAGHQRRPLPPPSSYGRFIAI